MLATLNCHLELLFPLAVASIELSDLRILARLKIDELAVVSLLFVNPVKVLAVALREGIDRLSVSSCAVLTCEEHCLGVKPVNVEIFKGRAASASSRSMCGTLPNACVFSNTPERSQFSMVLRLSAAALRACGILTFRAIL